MLTVSVIIPVYRSEQILPELYRQLFAAMAEITPDFEIIFIEDGGGDGSWPIIVSLAQADHRVRGIRMSRNYGQHNALLCGIRAARYDIIRHNGRRSSAPGQRDRSNARSTRALNTTSSMAPRKTEQHGFLRNIASRLTKIALADAMGANNARSVSAFRVFRTRLRQGFQAYRSPSVSIDVLLTGPHPASPPSR